MMERDPENPRLEAGETSRAAAAKRTGLRGQPQAEGARSGGEDMGGQVRAGMELLCGRQHHPVPSAWEEGGIQRALACCWETPSLKVHSYNCNCSCFF